MGRQNIAFLYGRVSRPPITQINKDAGDYIYGMVYLDTVRGLRPVDDGVKYVKHNNPLIMSREKEVLDSMRYWEENDIVFVKGVISTKSIPKTSFCPNCHDDDGNPVKNEVRGNLIYVTPIYVNKVRSYDDKNAAIQDLVNNREISNQIYVMGTLVRNPEFFTTKKGLQITQYPIAINRKFTIRTDDPIVRTDYPIVKTYGEQARGDKLFLQTGTEIITDGFIQARTVTRKTKCSCCGQIYEYKDHSMEIVPYDVEYVSGFRTVEEIEAEENKGVEELKQMLYDSAFGDGDELSEESKSDDVSG